MNLKVFVFLCVVCGCTRADDTDLLLNDLFREISNALNSEEGQTRQHYRPQNNGISLGVYEALRSIARNDDLQCISRLLCEAAAGGQPGSSGKQIKFDKLSLTNLISYLKLDSGSSSPLLVFGRAALLGVSNRGDPYSCIINYPKCPKDQSRLLYYLNNHRGGFFQYFDNKYHKPGNYYYQNQYRPGYYYQNQYQPGYNSQTYQKKFKRNKIQFESPNGLYENFKKKATSDVYAKKYGHSSMTFPRESYDRNKKPMVFPNDRTSGPDPRILTQPLRIPSGGKDFVFSNSNRLPKKLNDLNFFPQRDQFLKQPANYVTDRLPNRLNFPQDKEISYTNYPIRYAPSSFFPVS